MNAEPSQIIQCIIYFLDWEEKLTFLVLLFFKIILLFCTSFLFRGWRDGSTVKSARCSALPEVLSYQQLHDDLQPSVT